jgi:hypothetical protein
MKRVLTLSALALLGLGPIGTRAQVTTDTEGGPSSGQRSPWDNNDRDRSPWDDRNDRNDRDVRIELWTDRGENATYCSGESVRLQFRADEDSYVTVYNLDTDGPLTSKW